jgi:hypothetical protein
LQSPLQEDTNESKKERMQKLCEVTNPKDEKSTKSHFSPK